MSEKMSAFEIAEIIAKVMDRGGSGKVRFFVENKKGRALIVSLTRQEDYIPSKGFGVIFDVDITSETGQQRSYYVGNYTSLLAISGTLEGVKVLHIQHCEPVQGPVNKGEEEPLYVFFD